MKRRHDTAKRLGDGDEDRYVGGGRNDHDGEEHSSYVESLCALSSNLHHPTSSPVMAGDLCHGMLSIKDVVKEVLIQERKERDDLEDIVTDSYSHKAHKMQ